MNVINKDPWPVYYLVGSEVLTTGGTLATFWINHGSEYLWIPLTLGLTLAIAFYWNAVHICEEKDNYIEQNESKNSFSSEIKNLSWKVDALEKKVNENDNGSQGIQKYKD